MSLTLFAHAQGNVYIVPPSSSTSSNVPWISDEEMERCVVLYNEIEWLGDKISGMQVNQYSQDSVDLYNSKIDKHSSMVSQFNTKCAGKQSESAYRAARKLNAN